MNKASEKIQLSLTTDELSTLCEALETLRTVQMKSVRTLNADIKSGKATPEHRSQIESHLDKAANANGLHDIIENAQAFGQDLRN